MTRTRFSNGKKIMQRTKKPVKWNEDRIRQAYLLALLFGATDVQIAKVMGVNEHTISYWKRTKPEFLEALNKGKLSKDEQVERSLFERAVGYSHSDVHISNYQGEITTTEIIKHYPPSEVACIFWLKNRQRQKWADIQKSQIDINYKHIDLTAFTRDQLEMMESVGMKLLQPHQE